MKKKISIIAIVVALILLFFTAFSYATEVELITSDEGNATTEGGSEENEYEIYEEDLFCVEQNDYEMDKLVDGNVYLIVDGNIKFTGSVKGAVYILASGTVEFTEEAYIADAIYIAADSVKVNAEVYDIYSFSNNFELGMYGYVSRDVKVMASNINLIGTIYRDAYLEGENIEVKNEDIELLIGGDFNYSSPTEIEGIKEIVKYGNVNFSMEEPEQEVEPVETTEDIIKDYASNAATSVVYVFIIFAILKLIAPKFVERTGTDLKEKGIVAFTVGLLSWVMITLALVASLILLFTPIGLPVSIVAWIAMLVIIFTSPAVFSIAILDVVKQKSEKVRGNLGLEILVLAIIAICVWGVQKLPYVGGFASLVVVTTGVGLIIRNLRAKIENHKVEETAPVVEETNKTE